MKLYIHVAFLTASFYSFRKYVKQIKPDWIFHYIYYSFKIAPGHIGNVTFYNWNLLLFIDSGHSF